MTRFAPGGPRARLATPPRRQVDLASRGAARRDGRRAGPRARLPRAADTLRRSPRSGARRARRAAPGRARDPRPRPARARRESDGAIDVGNAGTLMRLLPGGSPGSTGGAWSSTATSRSAAGPSTGSPSRCADGCASSRRATAASPPFTVPGARLRVIDYELPVASAQVKSCVLLAGLAPTGATTVDRATAEPRPHRAPALRGRVRSSATGTRRRCHADELELEECSSPATRRRPRS